MTAILRGLRHVGVIDLGSNTARLVIYAYEPRMSYKLTDQVRQRVRLAEGFSESNWLQPAPIERAIETLSMFRSLCQASQVSHMIAVATSAVRDAANQAAFLRQAKRRAKLDVRVLSGAEEAYYGYLGVINTINVHDGLLYDLGGGSIQITQIARRKLAHSVSLPLGVVRMTERFMPDMPPSRRQILALGDHIAGELNKSQWLADVRGAASQKLGTLIGMGGTARALAKLDQASQSYPLERLHGYQLSLNAVENLVAQMSRMSARELLAMPGMNADRVDVILPGAIIVRELMRFGGFEQFTVSGAGVREGLFFTEFLADARVPIINDVRAFSVENTARQYGAWNDHSHHVRKLTLQLFDQLAPLHGLGVWEREILAAAAILHDVGYAVSFYDHDEHSQYLILNSDLPAFTHHELALLGLLARYHRKGVPDCQPLCELLDRDDTARATPMVAMLRLAEFLERGRRQTVRNLMCNIGDEEIVIAARTRGDAAIELWEANRNVALMEKAFGRAVRIVKE